MPNCLSPQSNTEQRKAMLCLSWIYAGIQQRNQKYLCSRDCNITISSKHEKLFQKHQNYACDKKQG